jgi:hypothetical protein
MVLVYATNADLTAWLAGAALPANATVLLRSASMLVRSSTVTALYDVDTEGLPSDATVLEAFTDATCAQAAFWAAAGVDPVAGGVSTTAPVRSKKLGSGAVEYDTGVSASVTAFSAKQAAANSLCGEAWMILQQAGIVPGGVQRG